MLVHFWRDPYVIFNGEFCSVRFGQYEVVFSAAIIASGSSNLLSDPSPWSSQRFLGLSPTRLVMVMLSAINQ